MIKMLKKALIPSKYRLWYNEWVIKHARGHVLDIGKSAYWDYGFPTLDIRAGADIIGDICNNSLPADTYDTVLCNGMYEFVESPQKMIMEVYRILKNGGLAVFGFVGQDYKPYKKKWDFYMEGSVNFGRFEILATKDFNKEYHFIVCRK